MKYTRKNKVQKLQSLIRQMAENNQYIAKELESLPDLIETHIKKIITSTFSPEDINLFVIKELFDIYTAADGRKAIIEHVKGKPKELLNLLKLMNDIATKLLELEKSKNSGNTNNGVMVQIVGLDSTPQIKAKAQ